MNKCLSRCTGIMSTLMSTVCLLFLYIWSLSGSATFNTLINCLHIHQNMTDFMACFSAHNRSLFCTLARIRMVSGVNDAGVGGCSGAWVDLPARCTQLITSSYVLLVIMALFPKDVAVKVNIFYGFTMKC